MNKNMMKKLLTASLMSILVPCGAFATMYVDHFASPESGQAITQVLVGSTSSYFDGMGSSTLSGTRYLEVTKTGDSTGGSHAVDINNSAYPSVMADSLEAGVNGFTRLIWDGNNNNTIEYTMPFVDLTEGGLNTFINIHVLSNDLPGKFTLNFGDGTINKDVTVNIPNYYTIFPIDILIPFSEWTGVNFSQIRGAGMLLDLVSNEDFRFDFVSATAPVPEPGTMVLLGAGLLGLAVFGKRRMTKENQNILSLRN